MTNRKTRSEQNAAKAKNKKTPIEIKEEPTPQELEKIESETGLEAMDMTSREIGAALAGDTDRLDALELESLEAETGLEEVEVDPDALDTIAVDPVDDNYDLNDDGVIDEEDENPVISDLPPEMTQSLGTGLQGARTDRPGNRVRHNQHERFNSTDPVVTGGDVDAFYETEQAVGEETVGGTVATPDKDVVDDLGTAVGLEVDDRSFLRTNDMLEDRDDDRWELDPKSSEDYKARHPENYKKPRQDDR